MSLSSRNPNVDIALSRELGRAVRARNGRCYRNSSEALWRVTDASYVEGWAVLEGHSLVVEAEHGWLELPDGTILDPTPYYHRRNRMAIRYFPGRRWTLTELCTFVCGIAQPTYPLRAWSTPNDNEIFGLADAARYAFERREALYRRS